MVCLVPQTKVQSDPKRNDKSEIVKYEAKMSETGDEDKLKLQRIAGGSIIDRPPLFSPDGDVLLISFKNLIHVYSTTTGEWLRDLDGNGEDIVAIAYELNNSKIVAALTTQGTVVRWKWKSGSIETRQKLLPLVGCDVRSFHFVDLLPDAAAVFVIYSHPRHQHIEWAVFDTSNGQKIEISVSMELKNMPILVDIENVNFHYVVVAQESFLYVMNYKNGQLKRWKNATKSRFTIVRVHPREEMIATGDEMGRIFLWRNIYGIGSKQPRTTLYHWHHTPVTSIAFTQSGTGFYSSGQESVLVYWNLDRPDLKKFLPRMHAIVIHVTVSKDNRKVAVCTADNGIQILDAQNNAKCMLQGFTYLYNDKTGLEKFPIGLKINPRTNSLALNGRVGHIQFYSTYTRRLLYNVDVVIQNQLSVEKEKILYNIRVAAAAFNVDWMATIEEWNDQENLPELRLKFWKFQKETQSYTLNTNIEGPHEKGVKTIEFSSATDTENLLCATAGHDNSIKMWSLEDSDNIYKKGKVWFCISRTSYKNFELGSINFSQDGSLLAAGFQNVLCIYKSQTLQLKAAMSAPARFTGVVQKVEITVPKSDKKEAQSIMKNKKNDSIEKQKQTLELFKSFLETNDEKLIQELKTKKKALKSKKSTTLLSSLTFDQEENLFRKIRSLTDLSLFQKINLFQKLGIYCAVPNESRRKLLKYISQNILEKDYIESNLDRIIRNVSPRDVFKAKYRMYKYTSRKRKDNDEKKLISVMDLLSLNDSYVGSRSKSLSSAEKSDQSSKCNGFVESDEVMKDSCEIETTNLSSVQIVQNIKHVCFAAGEFAHLIVACTQHRVLIWDITTLRLQSVLRLSVDRITVDPLTSLFAAFTSSNELYIFAPNAPMPIYHRTNVPKIYDAAWVPRRYPKSYSLNSDWQSISTLYFLTENQELMYFASENDADDIASTISFMNEAQEITRYSIFGTFAAKQANAKIVQSSKFSNSAIGVPGKATVKSLLEMSTHTMAPVHLMSTNFVQSLLRAEANQKWKSADENKVDVEEQENADGDDESDVEVTSSKRKLPMNQLKTGSDIVNREGSSQSKQVKQRERLRKVFKEKVEVTF